MNGKTKSKGLFKVSIYFNETDLMRIIKEAEKLEFRRVGLPIKTQKPHGLADEWVANTDGTAKMLKKAFEYYMENEADRAQKRVDLLLREKAMLEEKKKLGLV